MKLWSSEQYDKDKENRLKQFQTIGPQAACSPRIWVLRSAQYFIWVYVTTSTKVQNESFNNLTTLSNQDWRFLTGDLLRLQVFIITSHKSLLNDRGKSLHRYWVVVVTMRAMKLFWKKCLNIMSKISKTFPERIQFLFKIKTGKKRNSRRWSNY